MVGAIRTQASWLMAGALMMWVAGPANGQAFVHLGFDGVTPGTTVLGDPEVGGQISGGTVVPGTELFPALSGTQVYGGTSMRFVVDFRCCYSSYIGVFVTGEDVVRADFFLKESVAEGPVSFFATRATSGPNRVGDPGSPHELLEIGEAFGDGPWLVEMQLSSKGYFTVDDLLLGGTQGIPEPSTWAMLISGFALVGAGLRRRAALSARTEA